VEIEAFERVGQLRRIAATIWVERDGQKAIVIGEGGERLKQIGSAARLQMEKLFGGRVHIEIWVKVRADWSDNERSLRQLGFD
jgi:GTP-binding protein Era